MDEFYYDEEYQRDLHDVGQTSEERGLYDSLEESPKKKAKRASSWLLTVVQVSVCGGLVVAALVLKVFGGELYTNVRDWYVKNINNSIVAEEQADQFRTKALEFMPKASSAPESSEVESNEISETEST